MRFNLVLNDDLSDKFQKHVPEGIRSEFCRILLEMSFEAAEEHGPGFVGFVMAKQLSFVPNESEIQNLEPSDEK